MEDTVNYCYLASCIQTQQLQRDILHSIPTKGPAYHRALDSFLDSCGVDLSTLSIDETAPHVMHNLTVQFFASVTKEMPSKFNMTRRDSALWQCNKVNHAQDYLLVIPAEGLGQKMGARQFYAVLGYRLGIPLFADDSACSCCGRDMDIYGDHALHCAREFGLKFRHDLVRDTFVDICFRAGIHSKTEAALGFLSRDGGDSRPADILVYNSDNGQDICLDVTGVSPFTGGGVQAFTPSLALTKAIDRKRHKYLEIYRANGYSFGTLAFTTMGALGDETQDFLTRLKNYLTRHDANSNVDKFLFIRIGLAIQKGVGAQLVARLPTSRL